jgi:MFS family permease
MENLEARLEAWQSAKLITEKQGSAIRQFEAGKVAAQPPPSRGGPLAEAVGYVGAAIALAAVAILLADRWKDLNLGGRIGIVGLLTLVVASAGFALRKSERDPLERLVSVLLTASVLGATWIVGILVAEMTAFHAYDVALICAAAALAMSVALYRWRARALPLLAMLASSLAIVIATFARPALSQEGTWGGLAAWALGAFWVMLAWGRWLKPEPIAAAAGSLLAIVGAIVGAATGHSNLAVLALGLLTAGALMTRAVLRGTTYLVAIGAVGVLIFIPWLVTDIFGNTIGALVSMAVVGLLLILVSVRLARGRKGGHSAVKEGVS